MNGEVHYDLTKRWAIQEGFSAEEAERIAAADWACDAKYINTLADKRYHWPVFGSPVVALRRFRSAVATGDLALLGEALHAAQDTIGHGVHGHFWHWPGIDRLERRTPMVATGSSVDRAACLRRIGADAGRSSEAAASSVHGANTPA